MKPIHQYTLKDIKMNADKFIWNLCSHTYLNESKPGFLGDRRVVVKQANAIKFDKGSWLTFPKASESSLFMSGGNLCLAIQLDPVNNPAHQMVYELKEVA